MFIFLLELFRRQCPLHAFFILTHFTITSIYSPPTNAPITLFYSSYLCLLLRVHVLPYFPPLPLYLTPLPLTPFHLPPHLLPIHATLVAYLPFCRNLLMINTHVLLISCPLLTETTRNPIHCFSFPVHSKLVSLACSRLTMPLERNFDYRFTSALVWTMSEEKMPCLGFTRSLVFSFFSFFEGVSWALVFQLSKSTVERCSVSS